MSTKQRINFDSNVSKLMKKYSNQNVKVNKTAKIEISEVLNAVHVKLLSTFKTEYGSSKKLTDEEVEQCVKRTIQKTIPYNLRKCALAEAERQLTLFKNGTLQYDSVKSLEALKMIPAYRPKSRKKVKKIATAYEEFCGAVQHVLSTMYNDIKIERSAKQLIGLHLYELIKNIADKTTKNNSDKSCLEPSDVRNVLSEYLPPDILECADREGARKLTLYAHEILQFIPKKPPPAPVTSHQTEVQDKYTSESEGHIPTLMFKNSIKKLLAGHSKNVDFKFDKIWLKDLGEILYDFADSLSERVAEISLKNDKEEVGFQEVEKVIREVLPHDIYQHAASLGYNDVKSFVKGILKYKKVLPTDTAKTKKVAKKIPKPTVKSKKKKQQKSKRGLSGKKTVKSKSPKKQATARYMTKPTTRGIYEGGADSTTPLRKIKLDFTDEIVMVLRLVNRDSTASIGRDTINMLNRYLIDICNALILETARQKTSQITLQVIRQSVTNILPPYLANLAIANAARRILGEMQEFGEGGEEIMELEQYVREVENEIDEPLTHELERQSSIDDSEKLSELSHEENFESMSGESEGKEELDDTLELLDEAETIAEKPAEVDEEKPAEVDEEEPAEVDEEELAEVDEEEPDEVDEEEPDEVDEKEPDEVDEEEPVETEEEKPTEDDEVKPAEDNEEKPTEGDEEKSAEDDEDNSALFTINL